MGALLDQVNAPADLKGLSKSELARLAGEIREQMLVRLSATGGHVGSNLAVIEATVALHTVFNSPVDKIVFDVSHQCYTHKLLTGRKAAYTDPAQYGTVTGFTNPRESVHDIFSIGHTSTAISLACGLARARDLKCESYYVVAVVGDGSLSGGEALAGLNNAAASGRNLIIVVNDNDMSIAENHGGLYQNLKLLRETGGAAECNLFRAMGLDYRFVRDGHDMGQLLEAFEEVKDACHPTVVHICTIKGKGYRFAEEDRENWHYMAPFDLETGRPRYAVKERETYENLTRDFLMEKMAEDPAITAITAGTPKIFGFDETLRKQFPRQFIDVGIAEEHAVALASGIAKNGGRPVFGASSTFLQRTYDQLSHDLALNRSPAVILVFFAGISQGSQTHMGVSDLAMVRSIPGLVCLAPTCKEEYLHVLDWALRQTDHPVVIRVPGVEAVSRDAEAVAYCREHGLMYGTSDTTFEPEGLLTRAMLVTVLYRSAGSPAVTGADNFADTVEGAYYADAVVWASQQSIVDGYGNGQFGTDDPITQSQMRLIFQRYAEAATTEGIPGFDGSSRYATRAQAASALMNLALSGQAASTPGTADGGNILIAYFSFEGHTKQIAEEIQKQTGGDLFEITPEKPYTGTRNDLSGIASAELRENARPALSSHVDDMEQYDVVFVGYPCWWSNAPMAVFTFLEEYDFSGKTVIPFTSYGESVWGQSIASIQKSVGDVTVADGLAVQKHSMEDLPEQVTAWLQGLSLISK